jgi:short-subunit dehydrogenase
VLEKAMTMIMTKSILITGCSSGIGYTVAKGLQDRGYDVYATARKPDDVEKLKQEGLTSFLLDLSDSHSINLALEKVLACTNGKLYGLFNNGAFGQPGAVEDLSRQVLENQFSHNFFGTHELTNLVLPIMRQQGEGRIIYNSSILGFIALPYRGAYNASKFALEGLVDTLRLELMLTKQNIYTSLIEPGPITSRFRPNAHAAFRQNIDPINSAHKSFYEAMEVRLQKKGNAVPFTLPPEAVLKKVIHALESKRPKVRYPVTFPTYLFAFLKRVLTHRAMDRMLIRTSGEAKR